MSNRWLAACLLFAVVPISSLTMTSQAADKPGADAVGRGKQQLAQLRTPAVNFLRNTQGDDGSWTSPTAPGISALVTYSLLRSGLTAEDPTVKRSLQYLQSFVKPDGGIYYAKSNHRNYETCIALLVFGAAASDDRYAALIANGKKFLRGLQWDSGEGLESSDTGFGGAGYGSHERPDLSNTQFLVEALRSAGVPEDDPAMQNALLFISRCQNLESPKNTTPFSAKVNDGGFYYTPAAGGTSQAGKTANGGLRSYGSMTYAGLKSMVYAGLKSDDPRVQAALAWIRRHYTVDQNPGLGQQGLFYYYHTFAKTLAVLEVDQLKDSDGKQHDWRADLADKLKSLQRDNGSWVNRADRWYEGDPNLSTAYALLALSHCVHENVVVYVLSDGSISVRYGSAKPVRSLKALERMLVQLQVARPRLPVVLRADADTEYRHVVAAMDACRRAKILSITIQSQ
ncbi:MAG: biopolymer transporter ExbD [Planctomycetaceae bacterium]